MNIIWNCLVVAGIINERGEILTDNIDSTKLEEILTPEISQYKHRVSFLLKKCVNREKHIKVPNFLKKFVERHLSSWIRSAINALLMAPGQSYVVDYKKSGSKADRNASIIILDNDTGADQGSSQWDEALHQFLQLKHGCKLSMQSLKAVFVSNVTYFKMYKLLYGLTGTLGSERERNLLKDIHNVAFVTIPTAKPKQFEEYEPIISGGYRTWRKNITTEVCKLINEEKRSVLIICDTINDAESIKDTLKGMFPTQLHTYTRDYQEFDIVEGCKQLQQGQIIIATNLAGRGTDIRITDALKQSGGLHVILTYLPENIRIEEQAFGRAARSGDKGSGQLIIMVSSQRQYRRSKIIELKKTRDENELYRISDIKTYYEKTIKAEEICFDEFKQVYEKHRKSLEAVDVPSEVTTILLQNCLDQWSFWLDEHSRYMENIMQECDERGVPTLVQTFVSKLSGFESGKCVKDAVRISYFKSQKWKDWVEGNPMQMIKLANYLSGTNLKKCRMTEDELLEYAFDIFETNQENGVTHYGIINYGMLLADETAMSLYDDVIKIEPQFSEAAHYYRAYTLMKSIEQEETLQSEENKKKYKDFKKHLREAIRLFEDHHAFALQAAIITNNLKGNNVWHDEYQAQKDTIAKLYQTFIRSIEDIFGHAVSHNTFVTDEIKENVAEHIFMQLIEKGVISRPKVRKTISEQQLRMIHNDYGVSIEVLKKFLSENAGLIVEEEFIKACKENIPLPSREEFWQLLIDQKVLNSIKKYAIVDKAKLEALDPSLKDALDGKIADKTFVTETIEPTPGQIVLYREELSLRSTENNDSETNTIVPYVIFEKEYFVSLIGKEKFEMMVKKDIIRCNEMANVDRDMIASCKFSSFDSISVEDIVLRANIAQVEAELIMQELINRAVLEREGESFVLNENFRGSEEELLPSYPLYEDTIRGLLSSCFAYRLALNHIKEQLESDSSADNPMLRIELKCNPHLQFFQDLINQNIIRPYIVNKADCNEILNEIFYLNKNYLVVERWFRKMLHISKPDSERFLNNVYRFASGVDTFNWLDYLNPANLNPFGNEMNEISRFIKMLFFVRNKISGISFIPTNQAKELMQYDMRRTIELLFVQLDEFYKKESKSHVESVLGPIKSSLIGLKVAGIYFKPIREAGQLIENNFGTIEEEQLFTLNGLQHLLQVMEKKWSMEMLLNVGKVVLIGVAQIVAAAILEIYSAGALTHVASGLINEGVNDIMYAVNSFNSGYFSWQDYRKEKIKSVIFTAITAGVGAYASRGTKVSRIANKVAGPGLMKDGKVISELTGKAMWNEITGKRVIREFTKRIVMKTAQGFAHSAASIMVDKFTDDYLQALINSIVADILSQVPTTVDNHKISQNLRRIYDELGEQQARRLILQLSPFASNDWGACISLAKQFTSSLSQGFASAMQKTQNNGNVMKLLSNISTAWIWIERVIEIGKMMYVVGTHLDDLDEQINKKFETMLQNSSSNVQPNESNFEQFRDEIIKQWKSQLSEHVGKIISQNLVKPLLNDALLRVGRFIKRIPHNIKRIALKRKMKRLKKKYDKAVNAPNVTDEIKDSLKEDYHNKLKKIMCKTKSPTLLSNIIEEGVPMDLTCAAACAPLVHELLKKMKINVKGIVLTVQGDKGIEQTFCSGSTKGENVREIVLQLKDNHFTFSDNQLDVGNNNCLFAGMSDAIPELSSIKPEEFRKQIANTIRTAPEIQHRIRQGWHRFAIKQYDAVGGKSASNKRISLKKVSRELSPNRAIENKDIASLLDKFEGYIPPKNCPDAVNPDSHLYSRMTIYSFELAGAAQAIKEELKIEFEEIINLEKGASNTKDDLPVIPGGDIHRAHTLRGTINEDGKLKEHPEILEAVRQYMARCEYVPKEANQYRNVPKYVDNNQMFSVNGIANTHDFSKPPTDDNILITKTHLQNEITAFHTHLTRNEKKYDNSSLQLGNRLLTNLSNTVKSRNDLKLNYESGQFGYYKMKSIIEAYRKNTKEVSDLNRRQ
ncbi:uncharacterized protein LOC125770108 isoform X10 [Anopheles funestus]|uniref:uncharacterized protein LOC125770108 isoform X10 n=1 Tax=Anopheles funestus TaxID=62324 RepID=UPI0020C6BF2A|nr:uncharacterized protein LOC125770108 isoform X10 [Anopheles funestus]